MGIAQIMSAPRVPGQGRTIPVMILGIKFLFGFGGFDDAITPGDSEYERCRLRRAEMFLNQEIERNVRSDMPAHERGKLGCPKSAGLFWGVSRCD